MDQRHSEITAAVMRFRNVIENNNDCLPDHLKDFPAGCCSDVSDLLATHLSSEGFGDFDLISAQRGSYGDQENPFRTHAWLRQGNLTIDITADQFPDFQQPVLVSNSSPWHERFEIRDLRPAGLIWISGPIRPALDEAYQCLRRQLSQ